jgi:hypothetical protein
MTCEVDGCDRAGRLSRGMCRAHYVRWYTTGDAGQGPVRAYGRLACAVPGCERKHFTHGYCKMHYGRWRSNGDPLIIGTVGAAHYLWAGDAIGYSGLHDRLRKSLGSASRYACRHCSGRAEEWAYDHADPQARHDPRTGLPYSPDAGRYMPLCKSCHQIFDNAQRRTA